LYIILKHILKFYGGCVSIYDKYLLIF